MAGPSVAWVDFELDELLPHGPLSAALLTKLRDNQEHLYEVAHAGGYGGGSAHTHASSGAAAADLVCHENLLVHSCPASTSSRNMNNGNTWELNGLATAQSFHDLPGVLIGGHTGTSNAYQIMGGDAGESKAIFGTDTADGMDCVASFFIRPLGENAMASGAISFGFADGSTSTFTSSASLAYTDISHTWTRVYSRFTQAGQGHSTDVRFLFRVSTAFTDGIMVTGLQVNRGRHLAPWTISNVEGSNVSECNTNYARMPDCPLLDWRISMSDAVDLTP